MWQKHATPMIISVPAVITWGDTIGRVSLAVCHSQWVGAFFFFFKLDLFYEVLDKQVIAY